MSDTLESLLSQRLTTQDFDVLHMGLTKQGFVRYNSFQYGMDFLSSGYYRGTEAFILPHAHFIDGPVYFSDVEDPQQLLNAYEIRDKYSLVCGLTDSATFFGPLVIGCLLVNRDSVELIDGLKVIGGVVTGMGLYLTNVGEKLVSALSPRYRNAMNEIREVNTHKVTGKQAVIEALKN